MKNINVKCVICPKYKKILNGYRMNVNVWFTLNRKFEKW